jgi:hypothetical protein
MTEKPFSDPAAGGAHGLCFERAHDLGAPAQHAPNPQHRGASSALVLAGNTLPIPSFCGAKRAINQI